MAQIAGGNELNEDTLELEGLMSELRRKFERRPDDLIPVLQRVQGALGYLPERALLEIASITGVPSSKVFGVATFYAQFRLQPVGKHIIRICRGTACHVRQPKIDFLHLRQLPASDPAPWHRWL
jgi:NADH:ubiquinone oxidoreductase subunit E